MEIQDPHQVTVAAVQMRVTDDRAENIERAIELTSSAAASGAQIVCLQELFASPYFCQSQDHDNFRLAESIPGPLTQHFSGIAKKLDIVIIVPLFERRTAGLFHNSAAVIDRDGLLAGVYRKMHIPDDPCFNEKFYFTPGDSGVSCIETGWGKIGIRICWDQWFPEAARLTALAGADFIFYPTAIGWLLPEKQDFGESQLDAWRTIMRSHAIANGLFVIAPNRIGIEGSIEFWGHSFIADPYGNVVASAEGEQEVIIAECDLNLIETARTHWPFLRDRRIDAYDGINQRILED